MRVTDVEAIPVSVPVETAYETSLSVGGEGEQHYDHVIVRVSTDAGVVGVGEVAPMAAWPHGLTQAAVLSLVEETLGPVVEGRELDRVPRLVEDCWRTLAGEPFPLCGVDEALWDALGKAREVPVYDLLGGPIDEGTEIELHHSIGIKAPEEVRADAAAAADDGRTAYKVKVGGPDFAAECEAVAAIVDAVPEARIRVDANQGWSPPEAMRRIPELEAAADGLVLVEQPVAYDDVAGLARVRERVDVPILADEACFGPRDVARLAEANACDAVNIKLAKSGGLHRGREVGTVAAAHGLPCFMGTMVELGVGTAATAHFMASCPAIGYPSGVMNSHAVHTLVAEQDRWTATGDTFAVPDEPGLGVTLDGDALAAYRTD